MDQPPFFPFPLPLPCCSWDDSSSVSSGLSDTLDNISTDDLNTPAYTAVSSTRKSKGAQVKTQVHLDGIFWPVGSFQIFSCASSTVL